MRGPGKSRNSAHSDPEPTTILRCLPLALRPSLPVTGSCPSGNLVPASPSSFQHSQPTAFGSSINPLPHGASASPSTPYATHLPHLVAEITSEVMRFWTPLRCSAPVDRSDHKSIVSAALSAAILTRFAHSWFFPTPDCLIDIDW